MKKKNKKQSKGRKRRQSKNKRSYTRKQNKKKIKPNNKASQKGRRRRSTIPVQRRILRASLSLDRRLVKSFSSTMYSSTPSHEQMSFVPACKKRKRESSCCATRPIVHGYCDQCGKLVLEPYITNRRLSIKKNGATHVCCSEDIVKTPLLCQLATSTKEFNQTEPTQHNIPGPHARKSIIIYVCSDDLVLATQTDRNPQVYSGIGLQTHISTGNTSKNYLGRDCCNHTSMPSQRVKPLQPHSHLIDNVCYHQPSITMITNETTTIKPMSESGISGPQPLITASKHEIEKKDERNECHKIGPGSDTDQQFEFGLQPQQTFVHTTRAQPHISTKIPLADATISQNNATDATEQPRVIHSASEAAPQRKKKKEYQHTTTYPYHPLDNFGPIVSVELIDVVNQVIISPTEDTTKTLPHADQDAIVLYDAERDAHKKQRPKSHKHWIPHWEKDNVVCRCHPHRWTARASNSEASRSTSKVILCRYFDSSGFENSSDTNCLECRESVSQTNALLHQSVAQSTKTTPGADTMEISAEPELSMDSNGLTSTTRTTKTVRSKTDQLEPTSTKTYKKQKTAYTATHDRIFH